MGELEGRLQAGRTMLEQELGEPNVGVLGGPGSGKGTQCQTIVTRMGYTHLSSGDLLRNEVLSGSPRGLQIFRLMETGELVPTIVVLHLLTEAMVDKIYGGKAKGFLLDAFPCNIDQLLTGQHRNLDTQQETCSTRWRS